MKRRAIKLRYHTRPNRWGDRVTVAEAIDLDTQEVVASFTLEMMAAWLRKFGFRYVVGTSGVWTEAA